MDVALSLDGRVVVVTGGGAGIGLGVVQVLAARGARVVVAEKDPDFTARITATRGDVSVIPTDVAEPASIAALFTEITSRFGTLHGLVSNAGRTIQGTFLDFSLEDCEALWTTNLRSVFLCAQHAARLMQAGAQGGAIVNIASNHARASVPGFEMYAATKGGITAMTRAMAWSLGRHGIRVNALCPGLTRTERAQESINAKPGLEDVFNAWHATGRYNAPRDVGEVAAFLLSDAAIGITGAELIADNGMSSLLYAVPGAGTL